MELVKTESQKLQEIKNLEKFLRKPPQNSVVMEFTPTLAEHILSELNIGNRPQKPARIIDYAKDMAAHNWSLTGETICFGTDGRLKDGQNRLAACIRSQTPFKTHVVFGIDPATFHHMDTGKNRGADDILAIMGVPNAKNVATAMKFINAFKRGEPTTQGGMSNQAIKDMYLNEMDEKLLQRAVKAGNALWSVISYPVGSSSALYYLAAQNGEEELVKRFFDDLRVGGSKPNRFYAPRHLVETLVKLRMDRTLKISSQMYSVMLARTWYNFKHSKRSTKADMTVHLDDKMMPI